MPRTVLSAALFDRLLLAADDAGLAERRSRLLSAARGRVLEVGAGTGLNLRHYRGVDAVTALEPDPGLRARLRPRAAQVAFPVDVVPARLAEAALPHASFDTVVCTFVLCSVPDPAAALRILRDALAPGGELLFLEHVVVPGPVGRVQRLADPLWTRVAGGCHLDRDMPALVRSAGFLITDLERFALPGRLPLVGRGVLGRAKPVAREEAA